MTNWESALLHPDLMLYGDGRIKFGKKKKAKKKSTISSKTPNAWGDKTEDQAKLRIAIVKHSRLLTTLKKKANKEKLYFHSTSEKAHNQLARLAGRTHDAELRVKKLQKKVYGK